MRVVLIGTLPPPGGLNARLFAREAARRAALGDSVETISADPLSSSHRTMPLRGHRLASEVRTLAHEFDAVELRVEVALGLSPRSARRVAAALRGFEHVTLFLDSPIPYLGGTGGVLPSLWSSADSVVFANEADLSSIDFLPAIDKIVVEPECSDTSTASPAWPTSGESSLPAAVLDVVRRRARRPGGEPLSAPPASMLVTATERVHPSFKGSSIWLAKRVIGKSRGAVTKVLRPTPRKAS